MTDIQSSFKQKTKQIIYDGIQKSFEIVVSCHDKNCVPRVEAPSGRHSDSTNFDYIKYKTKELKQNLHTPYVLDLFLDVDNNKGVKSLLLERWNIHYDTKRRDTKEGRISSVNKHIGIMMRTLYCFVRLLPAFQLSTQSRQCPISFRIYNAESGFENRDRFETSVMSYAFPPIPTPFGNLTLTLRYLDSESIKAIYSEDVPAQLPSPAQGHKERERADSSEDQRRRSLDRRRHSVALTHDPIPIPNSRHGQPSSSGSSRRPDGARPVSMPSASNNVASTAPAPYSSATAWGASSTGERYYGELRSPTQPSNSLTRDPSRSPEKYPHGTNGTNGGENPGDVPDIPSLGRHQSRSADAAPGYLNAVAQDYFSPKGPQGHMDSRVRTLSRESEGGRPLSLKHGRPPQHPESSSYNSHSSSPHSGTPAPFYMNSSAYPTSSSYPNDEDPDALPLADISPPFQLPCVGLISTSPSTGQGGSLHTLRGQLIGTNRVGKGEKYYGYGARTPHSVTGHGSNSPMELMGLATSIHTLLPELPESPFDTDLGRDCYPLSREGHDGSSVGGAGESRSADTDCMFAYDDNDRDSLDGNEDEDMPFAYAAPQAESFEFQRPAVSSVSAKGLATNPSGSTSSNNQSFIAQQCMAPPVLASFESASTYSRNNDVGASAFAKLEQMKEFHMTFAQS